MDQQLFGTCYPTLIITSLMWMRSPMLPISDNLKLVLPSNRYEFFHADTT